MGGPASIDWFYGISAANELDSRLVGCYGDNWLFDTGAMTYLKEFLSKVDRLTREEVLENFLVK